jgi:triphosphatase
MEITLNMLVPRASVAALRRHPLVCKSAKSSPRKETHHDVYFDTPAWIVRAANASLCIRHDGTRTARIQTLKGGAGAQHSPRQWDARVAGDSPDLAALRSAVKRNSEYGALVRSPALERKLLPVFTIYVQHTAWEMRLEQGAEVDMALDEGFIERGAQRLPISEVELSLKSGDPAHLFDFALALQQDIALQIATSSTAERAYRLAASQPPLPVKATPPSLSGKMTVEQVFQAIAQNCLEHIQANQDGVAAGQDAESVHQMRVGLRRWKSAARLFRAVLQVPDELQQELDWLTKQLGAARDWDVLADSTLPAIAREVPESGQVAELQRAAAHIALAKHQAAAAAVNSPRYTRLMLSLARWIQSLGWRERSSQAVQALLAARVKPFARSALRRDRERLLKRGKKLPGGDPAARHQVRIAAKKTRYDTEFFESLYATAALRSYINALTTLQDELGWLNDATVAATLLKDLSAENRDLEGGAQFVRGYLASRIHAEDRAVLKRWKKLAPLKLGV